MKVPWYVLRSADNSKESLLPSSLWVLEIKLQLSGLVALLTEPSIWPALLSRYIMIMLILTESIAGGYFWKGQHISPFHHVCPI